MSKRLPSTMLLAFAAAFAGASPISLQWLDQNFIKRIFVSGHRELSFHMLRITGDKQAFKDLNYSGRGTSRFTNTGQVSVDGRNVFGVLNFQMQFADDRYTDPESRRVSLDYKKGPVSVSAGDIQGSVLNTNQFASFNRYLKGVSAGYQNGRFAFKGVTSQAKGAATTITLQGDNSVGPYYLQNSRLSKDSVRVMVDGTEMTLGTDYVVNYDTGSITFQNKIIPPTSTIVVTYESLSYNGAKGNIRGLGASYDFGKFGKLGVTSLAQDPTSQVGLSQRTDLFQGFGDPSTPYTLTYQPLQTRPVIVKLQGIIQTEGAQYRFDPNNPAVFYFLFPVPSTMNVDVTYTPKPIETVDGKRRVFGFDYTIPFNDKRGRGALTYNQATGSLENDVTPLRGTARSLSASYGRGGFQIRTSYRDVPNTFVGIQSTGFLRNEKSSNLSVSNTSGKLGYGLDWTNSLVGSRSSTNTGELTFNNARTTSMAAHISYAQSPTDIWSLTHARSTSQPVDAFETRLDTTSLSHSIKHGRLNTNIGFDQTSGVAPLADGSTTKLSNIGLQTLHLSNTYNAGAAWSLNMNVGLSDVHAGDKSGRGNDISFLAEYKPNQRLDVQFNASQSTSGSLPTLAGFQSGFGVGYGGNGFTSGVSGVGLIGNTVGNNFRSNMLGVTYQLTPKINIAARLNAGSSSGTIASNSSYRMGSLDVDCDLGRGNTTGLSVTNSHTEFHGSSLQSNATTLDWYVAGSPNDKWSYRLATNYLLSGGDTQFGQNSIGLDATLQRKIDAKQHLGFAWHSGRITGYQPQNDMAFQLYHDYQIYQNIALRTSYTWRKVLNMDPTLTAGAYQAHGFDIDLTFDFAP